MWAANFDRALWCRELVAQASEGTQDGIRVVNKDRAASSEVESSVVTHKESGSEPALDGREAMTRAR